MQTKLKIRGEGNWVKNLTIELTIDDLAKQLTTHQYMQLRLEVRKLWDIQDKEPKSTEPKYCECGENKGNGTICTNCGKPISEPKLYHATECNCYECRNGTSLKEKELKPDVGKQEVGIYKAEPKSEECKHFQSSQDRQCLILESKCVHINNQSKCNFFKPQTKPE